MERKREHPIITFATKVTSDLKRDKDSTIISIKRMPNSERSIITYLAEPMRDPKKYVANLKSKNALNLLTSYGLSPLHSAAFTMDLTLIRLLIKAGTNPHLSEYPDLDTADNLPIRGLMTVTDTWPASRKRKARAQLLNILGIYFKRNGILTSDKRFIEGHSLAWWKLTWREETRTPGAKLFNALQAQNFTAAISLIKKGADIRWGSAKTGQNVLGILKNMEHLDSTREKIAEVYKAIIETLPPETINHYFTISPGGFS